jgi:predicted 3-demethylubiquinone-9 3-methyltransferase (glyoxalase superfamily)
MITPFLWLDGQAGETAKFYTSIFKNSKIISLSPLTTRLCGGHTAANRNPTEPPNPNQNRRIR